jgi:hypothetical protein
MQGVLCGRFSHTSDFSVQTQQLLQFLTSPSCTSTLVLIVPVTALPESWQKQAEHEHDGKAAVLP